MFRQPLLSNSLRRFFLPPLLQLFPSHTIFPFPVAITACQRPPQAKQGTYNILNLFIPHKLLLRKPQCLGFRARIRDLLASSNDAAPEGEGFTALEELIDFAKSAMNIQLRAQEYRWAEELQSVCRLEEATYMI